MDGLIFHRSTGSGREISIRETLHAFVESMGAQLPRTLVLEIRDHLARRDQQGLSLCFWNAERDRLLNLVYQWCAQYDPVAGKALQRAIGASPHTVYALPLKGGQKRVGQQADVPF